MFLCLSAISMFQFHKGTIRTSVQSLEIATNLRFNSIKVRLERLMDYDAYYKYQSFNSIKVRLEQSVSRFIAAHFGFQFHKGTIRTTITNVKPSDFSAFQFHKGTIRTSDKMTSRPCLTSFNSIKVRLEQARRKQASKSIVCFNSIKVRLELTPSERKGEGK